MWKKNAILCALVTLLCCLCLSASAADTVALSPNTATMFEGETLSLQLLLNGAPVSDGVQWTSSATRVATVAQGNVTALSRGNATITATLRTGSRTYKATAKIQVLRAVTSLTVKEDRLTVLAPDDPSLQGLLTLESDLPVLVVSSGVQCSILADVLPKDASNRKYEVISSDDQIVYGPTGNLKVVSAGECLITVRSVQNPEISQQYHVLAVQKVKEIRITAPQTVLGVGYTLPLQAIVNPSTATMTAVKWESMATNCLSVDENGVVTGLARGSGRVRATSLDGSNVSGYITLEVQQQPTALQLDRTSVVVPMGKTTTLKATVLPANANKKSVDWYTSDANVCTVKNGVITPVAVGSATVTCVSQIDPSIYAVCDVRVIQPVKQITFTMKEIFLYQGTNGQVVWSVSPTTATDTSVTLTSSAPGVVEIDPYGNVAALKAGKATITATANDGSGVKGKITVNVLQHLTSARMKNDVAYLGIGESTKLQCLLTPSNYVDPVMLWESSDPRVAEVKGETTEPTVYGNRWGSTWISGVTRDGNLNVYCLVRVGDFGGALEIYDLYLSNNEIKMSIHNTSDMEIKRFDFTLECYDIYGAPLICNRNGSNTFSGHYLDILSAYQTTRHGRFAFTHYVQPPIQQFGYIILQLTSYETTDGYHYEWTKSERPTLSYRSPNYVGPTATPLITFTPDGTPREENSEN